MEYKRKCFKIKKNKVAVGSEIKCTSPLGGSPKETQSRHCRKSHTAQTPPRKKTPEFNPRQRKRMEVLFAGQGPGIALTRGPEDKDRALRGDDCQCGTGWTTLREGGKRFTEHFSPTKFKSLILTAPPPLQAQPMMSSGQRKNTSESGWVLWPVLKMLTCQIAYCCFRFSVLLMCLGGSREWPKCLYPCRPQWGSCGVPSCSITGCWGANQQMGDLFLLLWFGFLSR